MKNVMNLHCPEGFSEYELIDSGGREKLEKFGSYIIARPEPQALWPKNLNDAEWEQMTNAWFKPATGGHKANNDRGSWIRKPGMPDSWVIDYESAGIWKMRLKLALTSFSHVGIFPEQQPNWEFIFSTLKQFKNKPGQVLNLFAYTGASSLAARAAGAAVVHVDAVKPMISWARENMESSGLSGIQWVVEDALKFVRREVKRNKQYNGIILDPPAYGRGPEGEKWLLETGLPELLHLCSRILDKEEHFVILNMYSMGYSPLIAENLINSYFQEANPAESIELYLPDRAGKKLPAGICCRYKKTRV